MIKTLKTAFKLALPVILLTTLFTFFSPGRVLANPGWYNSTWLYRKSITINHLNVTANLSNFPVLINLTSDAGLAAHAMSNGYDILFTSADEVTKLPHEIESYNGTTGKLVAWVNVPSVSSTSDTVIYMYYGKAGASNQQNVTGVWDSNFKMVDHLNQTSGGTGAITDSTSNGNNGTDNNTPTFGATGKIDGAISFNRTTNQSIKLPASNAILNADNFTMEAWFNTTLNHPAYGDEGRIVNLHRGAAVGSAVSLYVTQNSTSGLAQVALFYYTTDSVSHYLTYEVNYNNGVNHHIAATHSTSDNTYRLYYDGVQVTSAVGDFIGFGTENGFIATHDGGQRSFTGTVDEVRLSKTVRSADWEKTSYNNQNSPSTFYTLGSEIGAATVTTNTASNIAGTTATVNGTLTFDGGEACQYQFEYGTTSGGPYGFNTGWTGSINTGAQFSAGLTGLAKGQKYYFRADAKNNYGTAYGAEQSFLTKPDAPSGFTATPGNQQISLSWTNGTGSTNTTIRGNIGSYPTSYTDGTAVYNGTGTSTTFSGLNNGDHWYFRAWSIAINGAMTQYSDTYIQADATPMNLPAVTTNSASSIADTTADLNGNITSIGGGTIDYRGFEWGTSTGVYSSNWTENGSFGTGAFSHGISSLTPGTTYYYRALAHNAAGIAYGSEQRFLTKPDSPTGLSISNVSGTQLDLSWTKGTGADRTMVRRSTSGYPATIADGTQVYFNTGAGFSDTGLTSGTTYYYRAWSEISDGVNQQWSDLFVSASAAPVGSPSVTTDTPSDVQSTTVTLQGTLTSDGGAACQFAFEWGTSPGVYTANISWTGSITTGQTFTTGLIGLTKGQPYYYVAMVKNAVGVVYGSEVHFLTRPDAPIGFTVSANGSISLDLSWTKGTGAQRTMVRRSVSGYPVSVTDGTEVYFNTGTNFTDTPLTSGVTYYYSAWSEVTGSQQWSASSVTAQMQAGASLVKAIGGTVLPVDKIEVAGPYFFYAVGILSVLALIGWRIFGAR